MVKYFSIGVLGLVAAWVGIPSLIRLESWDGWLVAWGLVLAISAGISGLAVWRDREGIEKWSGIVMMAMLGTYAFGAAFLSSQPFSDKAAWVVIVIIMLETPAARIGYLVSRSGLPTEGIK